ncbi:MAG TPA: hypothetical protein VMS31_02785, partial [Pyrinomonadaceae bacterium]|nr:hypothetical protein [Pyrinomonadaceae bacterium]
MGSPRSGRQLRTQANTVARSRGLTNHPGPSTWGSASHHPRLYALARYRGLYVPLSSYYVLNNA